MTVEELRRFGRALLKPLELLDSLNKVEQSILSQEVDQLLCAALSCSFTQLVMMGARTVSKEDQLTYRMMLERRLKHEPIGYIIGRVGFHAIELSVTPAVLIPRPETEVLVERTLEMFAADNVLPTVFDVGTGSGAILLAVVAALRDQFGDEYLRRGQFVGIDLSADAIKVAKLNAQQLELDSFLSFFAGDLAEHIGSYTRGHPEIIVANLPYIPEQELLPQAVQQYEPALALRGGVLGLELLFRLLEQVSVRIREGSILLLELGSEQYSDIDLRARERGFETRGFCDLHGVLRVAAVSAL